MRWKILTPTFVISLSVAGLPSGGALARNRADDGFAQALRAAGALAPGMQASGALLPGMLGTGRQIGAAIPFDPGMGGGSGGDLCGHMRMPPAAFRTVSRGFGPAHSGIDLVADWGTPIRAAAAGVIVAQGWDGGYGMMVDIRHADGVITRYGHMSAFTPGQAVGSTVAAGTEIGHVGDTGNSRGAHVHFEVRVGGHAVDPAPYLALAGCRGAPQSEPLEEAQAIEPGRHGTRTAGRR